MSPELLRAWEHRYGLLQPARSAGGFRLYSAADERRVRTMTTLIEGGISAAEAASRALVEADDQQGPGAYELGELGSALSSALEAFDGDGANRSIDRLLASASLETIFGRVLVPYLHDLGDRWARGEISIAQEHFASNLLRGRLLGLGRDWGTGVGSSIVLACPPGEEHDLALIMFGIVVARRGSRVVFLGADTPVATIRHALAATRASRVVVAAARADPLLEHGVELRDLAASARLWLCGAGAEAIDVGTFGADVLEGGPVQAARSVPP